MHTVDPRDLHAFGADEFALAFARQLHGHYQKVAKHLGIAAAPLPMWPPPDWLLDSSFVRKARGLCQYAQNGVLPEQWTVDCVKAALGVVLDALLSNGAMNHCREPFWFRDLDQLAKAIDLIEDVDLACVLAGCWVAVVQVEGRTVSVH